MVPVEKMKKRGAHVSTYKKNDLVNLAQSLHEIDAVIDPDFKEDSIEQMLKDSLTSPAGASVSNPFTMKKMSDDFSSLLNFGLMDIFNHLNMTKICWPRGTALMSTLYVKTVMKPNIM